MVYWYAALARDAGIVSVTFPNQLFTDSLRTIVFFFTAPRPGCLRLPYFSRIILAHANESAISVQLFYTFANE